ncbi:hypothetical protein UFOVP402_26 [uncultured Caudovirales phage]|uniref:Uncharacterized protein n=1 Tax=uncultured Caudovirales phage TaxID=2100421 RepID=A0A6J5M5M8_9CAUD|nr:hypothetical protein UFOVP402_26 [uncultured Caudovirales phage]
MKILLLTILPFLSFAQYGEGRTGRFTEHQLHGIGGFGIASIYYEGTRPKNNLNQTPEAYQKIEFKQAGKTMLVVIGAATVIELSDYMKGGKFSYHDWGATFTGGLASVMIHALGRMILQDRRDWRRKGLRLRL